jgi:hypothetical protein
MGLFTRWRLQAGVAAERRRIRELLDEHIATSQSAFERAKTDEERFRAASCIMIFQQLKKEIGR